MAHEDVEKLLTSIDAANKIGLGAVKHAGYGRAMALEPWAKAQAERLIAPLGDRWLHVQAVAGETRRVAAILPAGRLRVGWSTPAIPTGKARRARMGGGWAAGTATTRTTPSWGSPLCPRCYQTGPQVLWNALAGRLWSRTTIYVYRALAQLVRVTEGELRRLVRISFAKVAEYQKRGAIHFHAIIRLDAATDCGCPACVATPPAGFTAELLEAAVRQTAATVSVPCPALDEDQSVTLTARWGEELDVRHITEGGDDDRELSAEQVAGYVAKYATKGTEALGVTLDHRIGEVELEGLEVPAHVAELVRACWELAAAIAVPFPLLVRFDAYTGLRAGELAALRVGRLDLLRGACEVVESATEVDNKLVWGVTKNYERRTVRLPRFLCEQVGAYLADRPHAPDDLVFTMLQGGPLREPKFAERYFKPAARAAGLPAALRVHDLRHTCAS